MYKHEHSQRVHLNLCQCLFLETISLKRKEKLSTSMPQTPQSCILYTAHVYTMFGFRNYLISSDKRCNVLFNLDLLIFFASGGLRHTWPMLSFKNAAALPGSNDKYNISKSGLFQANHILTCWCSLKSKRDVRLLRTEDPRKLLNQCKRW